MAVCTLAEIAEIIEEVVDLGSHALSRDSVFGEDIVLDSQEMLRILARVKARFTVRFDHTTLVGIKAVGDLLDAIERGQSTSPAHGATARHADR